MLSFDLYYKKIYLKETNLTTGPYSWSQRHFQYWDVFEGQADQALDYLVMDDVNEVYKT